MHRIAPDIWITKTEDPALRTGWTKGQVLVEASKFYKDIRGKPPQKIGIAGPPIETPKGWLVIVHVVHERDFTNWQNRFFAHYTLGFMVLDLQDPARVKYIRPSPILWPEKSYEILGNVPQVCFSYVAVDLGKEIYIYWGGADTVICGGKIKKAELLAAF